MLPRNHPQIILGDFITRVGRHFIYDIKEQFDESIAYTNEEMIIHLTHFKIAQVIDQQMIISYIAHT